MPTVPGFRRVTVETPDGEKLAGFWKPPSGDAPVILTFHGNAAIPAPYADRFGSKPWSDLGYGALAVAYRGYPGSTGTPSKQGLTVDGQAAYDFVRVNAPSSPVVIHGHSLGSGVAVVTASRNPTLALLLDAPYPSLRDVAGSIYPFLPMRLMRDNFASIERIGSVDAKRIYIVHGTNDRIIPSRFGEALAAARPDAVLHLVAGGDHEDIMGIYDADVAAEIENFR